jgi:hypothetical protein
MNPPQVGVGLAPAKGMTDYINARASLATRKHDACIPTTNEKTPARAVPAPGSPLNGCARAGYRSKIIFLVCKKLVVARR